jgi:hypothetical protein
MYGTHLKKNRLIPQDRPRGGEYLGVSPHQAGESKRMCIRRPESVLFPILVILVLVTAVASALDQGEEAEAPKTSFFSRISEFTGNLRPEPKRAPLDDPFKPVGELTYVDLSKKVNKKLADGTIDIRGNTLRALKVEEATLAGVKFNVIDGVMQLTSENREHFPKSIEGIPVDKPFSKIYFFHSTQGSGDLADGTLIGKYVVHFDDSTDATIPIVVGEDVRDWWNVDRSKKVKRGRVAWVGSNSGVKGHGHSLRLFVSQWENPRPEAEVTSIDYISESISEAGPFCVAMTIESESAAASVIDGQAAENGC